MSTILESRVRDPSYLQVDCPACKTQLEYQIPTPPPKSARVRCASPLCKRIFDPPSSFASSSRSTSVGDKDKETAKPKGKRRMGTDDRPLETRYYDCLGVGPSATSEEIKKAYRRLAIKLHPDKNRDDNDAEEKFKEISIAYQTLMDPELRKKYNERGSSTDNAQEGFVDPEELFSTLFGGPKFEEMIGQISIGRTMKESLQAADTSEGEIDPEEAVKTFDPKTGKMIVTPEEKARVDKLKKEKQAVKDQERKERVDKLVGNLERKLSIFVEGVLGSSNGDTKEEDKRKAEKEVGASFKTMCVLEASDLILESYGAELLSSIGQVYQTRGSQYLTSTQSPFGGVLGWYHGAKGGMEALGETVGLVRAGLHLKNVFEKLQAAEKLGLTPEQMKALEEEAAVEGLKTLWRSAKMEVESVLRETCDTILSDPNASTEKRRLRAVGLELMGTAFTSVKKDVPEEEFVQVDTKASKERKQA